MCLEALEPLLGCQREHGANERRIGVGVVHLRKGGGGVRVRWGGMLELVVRGVHASSLPASGPSAPTAGPIPAAGAARRAPYPPSPLLMIAGSKLPWFV